LIARNSLTIDIAENPRQLAFKVADNGKYRMKVLNPARLL